MSRILRDSVLILQLEAPGMFTTCWTEDILAEVTYRLRRSRPDLDGAVIANVRDKIAGAMSERIDAYPMVDLADLGDPHDRHLHSAAVAASVHILVTSDTDLLSLPAATTDELPYEILSPDAFLVLADDSSPVAVGRMVARQWEHWRWRDPGFDLPARLAAAGCPDFGDRVRGHLRRL